MKTKIYLFILCLVSLNVMGQGTITRQSTRKTEQSGKQQPITKRNNPTKPRNGIINGHEWVDLGLSVKWATCNIGASSPSDYGGYYAWGETSTKSRYEWSNCFDCTDPSQLHKDSAWHTYKLKGLRSINPNSGHDTARELWGGTWRLPTDKENGELCKKCKWSWTSRNGHNGYIITGPNGNSIFLPAAGSRVGSSFASTDYLGTYWSSTLNSSTPSGAHYLFFNSTEHFTYYYNRSNGLTIRPVTE